MGKKVILVTHSPSTIAVALEESIFICERTARTPEIKRASKDKALNILLRNVNNVSVAHENRRQVFTEDRNDTLFYETIVKQHQKLLQPEISLHFIPVSVSAITGGCDRVKSIVGALREGGNKQVFGIIDRDTKNQRTGANGIFVPTLRHSLENYLFDPYLLFNFFVHHRVIPYKRLGLPKKFKTRNLHSMSNEDIQKGVDMLLSRFDIEATGRTKVTYVNGYSLMIPNWYLNKKGHDLVELILNVFAQVIGHLKASSKDHKKAFTKLMLIKILPEYPECLPRELLDILIQIQRAHD